MLRLALLRHAKSSWDDPALADFDRPLNDRGRAAAPVIGQLLASMKFAPDRVLCSPSARTTETLLGIAPFLKIPEGAIVAEHKLYHAGPDTLLDLIRNAPEESKTLLIVGHNPGLQALATRLAKSGDAGAIARLNEKYPTAGLALFSFLDGTWAEFDALSGHLDAFITPKDRA